MRHREDPRNGSQPTTGPCGQFCPLKKPFFIRLWRFCPTREASVVESSVPGSGPPSQFPGSGKVSVPLSACFLIGKWKWCSLSPFPRRLSPVLDASSPPSSHWRLRSARTSHLLLIPLGGVEGKWKMYASSTELSLFE